MNKSKAIQKIKLYLTDPTPGIVTVGLMRIAVRPVIYLEFNLGLN